MSTRLPSLKRTVLTSVALVGIWGFAHALRRTKSSPEGSPYHFKPPWIGILSLLLFLADLIAIPLILRGKQLITASELEEAIVRSFRWPDSLALRFDPEHRERTRSLSDKVLMGIIALPFLLLADKRIRRDAGSLLILYAWVHAITYTVYSFSPLGPAFNDKFRPVVYFKDLLPEVRNLGNNKNAMFSGHTGNAACASFFMAKAYSDHHPGLQPGYKAMLYSLASVPPLLLGWLRVKAGKHFPSDVLMAIGIGGSCGIMVPELYRMRP